MFGLLQHKNKKTTVQDLEHLNKQELQSLAINSSDIRIKVLARDLLLSKYI